MFNKGVKPTLTAQLWCHRGIRTRHRLLPQRHRWENSLWLIMAWAMCQVAAVYPESGGRSGLDISHKRDFLQWHGNLPACNLMGVTHRHVPECIVGMELL
jgi:hypothetical protein